MSGTISNFAGLHTLSGAGRLVATPDGNYKAANSGNTGSVLGRAVNFVKEAFHSLTGRVKAENAASYERARGDWVRANNGIETPGAKAFFDGKIASHARFEASALTPIIPKVVAGTAQAVQSMIPSGDSRDPATHPRDAIAGQPGLGLNHDLTKDLLRKFDLKIDGQPMTQSGRFVPTGERFQDHGNNAASFCADKVGNALIAEFGADYVEGISNIVHQGLGFSPVMMLMDGTAPLQLPDGSAFDASSFSLNNIGADLSRNADGTVHVKVTVSNTARDVPGYDKPDHPNHKLTPDSSIHTSYEFDIVKGSGPGKWNVQNATPISIAADLNLRKT